MVEGVRKGLPWGCGCCRARGDLAFVSRLGGEGSQTPPSSLSPRDAIYQILIPMFIKTKSEIKCTISWSFGCLGMTVPCFAVSLCSVPTVLDSSLVIPCECWHREAGRWEFLDLGSIGKHLPNAHPDSSTVLFPTCA